MNNFYDENYQHYFNSTVDIDPTAFLSPLAGYLWPGATILDVGCGSGRDLLWFKNQGYYPTGFELSPNLVNLARNHSGCPVVEGDFLNYDFSRFHFDALVLVGALVHQTRMELPTIIRSICRSLKKGGYLLITLKEGTGIYNGRDGREFTLWERDDIETVYAACGLEVLDFSHQISKLRSEDIWLGHVLKVKEED